MARLVSVVALLATGLILCPTQSSVAAEDWVVKAQKRLDALGCQAGPADGRLDRRTRSAVVRFQSRHGLAQSGRLDRHTRTRLHAQGTQAPARCDARPVPGHSGAGRRIVISQVQNWIWLVGRHGRTVAQGGMVDNPGVLKPGSYAVGSYCGRAARIERNQSASGRVWLDDFVRFAPCGIGFHRIPRYKSTGRQVHPDWFLGTDMDTSHGCIRLGRELAAQVWDFTARRTRVHVV